MKNVPDKYTAPNLEELNARIEFVLENSTAMEKMNLALIDVNQTLNRLGVRLSNIEVDVSKIRRAARSNEQLIGDAKDIVELIDEKIDTNTGKIQDQIDQKTAEVKEVVVEETNDAPVGRRWSAGPASRRSSARRTGSGAGRIGSGRANVSSTPSPSATPAAVPPKRPTTSSGSTQAALCWTRAICAASAGRATGRSNTGTLHKA